MSHSYRAIAAAALIANAALVAPVSHAAAATTAPKAYIGLFKDNAVAVYDTGSNSVMKTIPIPTGPHGLVVTPDGKWVYASSDGDSVVSVIDTSSDRVVDTIQVGQTPHGLAITPDGSKVLVADFGTDSVEAIDTSSNQIVWQTPVPQPHNIAITPDGMTAYAGGQKEGEQQIAILEVATGNEEGSVPLDHAPRALNVSTDGADLVYTLAGVDALQVLDLKTLQLDAQIPTGVSPHHPIFSVDGGLGMVVAQGPGEVDFFDPATYTATGTAKVGLMPHWIGLSSDGRWAYVTNENSNDVSVIDLSDRSVKTTVPVGNGPRKIVVQPSLSSSASSVTISGFKFSPASLTVSAGQQLSVMNSDGVTHTFTSSAWDSGDIQPGASYTFNAPSQAGTYQFHCSIHPFMTGTLTVQ